MTTDCVIFDEHKDNYFQAATAGHLHGQFTLANRSKELTFVIVALNC